MAAPTLNSQLVIAGVLRKARLETDPAAWLQAQHDAALTAVLAGDTFVSSTAFEGGSTTAERQIPATTLLEIMEACLQQYEAEVEAEEAGQASTPGSVRWADFSENPCTLG